MKKVLPRLLCCTLLVWLTFFCGDLLRFSQNEAPLFSVEWRTRDGYREYLGFGYKIGLYEGREGPHTVLGALWSELDQDHGRPAPPTGGVYSV